MNRFSAAAAILICLLLVAARPATAQTDQCFPWQELRDGRCVAKPSEAPQPPTLAATPPAPAASDPCPTGSRSLSGQCACPTDTHYDRPSNACVADATPAAPPSPQLAAPAPPAPPAPPPPPVTNQVVTCEGGRVTNGGCACPAGFHVMPILGVVAGGICVKTDAENCLGGELTVGGVCQCNGQVRMFGDIYLLEFVKGKCIPKHCPVQTVLKDGKCMTTSAVTPAPELQGTSKSTPLKEANTEPKDKEPSKDADDDDDHRHRCGHGMVRNRSGECVAVRRRSGGESVAKQYYRMYLGGN
jgi:hypothetical protein